MILLKLIYVCILGDHPSCFVKKNQEGIRLKAEGPIQRLRVLQSTIQEMNRAQSKFVAEELEKS